MKDSRLNISLSVFYVAIYIGMSSIGPYLILFYQQKGLTFAQIGIASAVFFITGVFTQPLWGFITDKYLNKRITLIIVGVASSLIIYSFIPVKSVYSVIMVVTLLSAFQSSIFPIADAYSYEIIEHNPKIQYGRIRLMGNIGYAAGALILGQLIQNYGLKITYFIYSAVMIIGSAVISTVRFEHKENENKINLKDGLKLFANKGFTLFIISVIIAYTAIGGNVNYLAILIQNAGGTTGNLGFVWFIIAMSSLPVLFFGRSWIRKFGGLNIYLFGALFYALRFFLDSVFESYDIILAVQLLESVSYPFFLMGTLEYLNRITPAKIKATSMTFYAAACGMGGFIGSITGGVLLGQVNVFMLYKLFTLVSFISIILIVILMRLNKSVNRYEIEEKAG